MSDVGAKIRVCRVEDEIDDDEDEVDDDEVGSDET